MYGKRSLWQWIIIYAIIGGLIYAAIYYFVLAKEGGYNSSGPSYTSPTVTPRTPSLTPETMMTPVSITLDEQNNSGESGSAILKEENGQTTITINLTGFTKDVPQPAHIHAGSCPGVGNVKYPLTNVVNGQSITTISATLAQLKQQLPLAINIHKSQSAIDTYTSCGKLPTN